MDALEKHQPKFDAEVLKALLLRVGLSSPDPRLYHMISLMLEDKLIQILKET